MLIDFKKACNMFSKQVCDPNVKNTNKYTPRIQKTVKTKEKSTYNEFRQNINEQLKIKL